MDKTSETRRIQLVGGSTYIVSLPKSWISELNLKSSDSVTLVKKPDKSLKLFKSEIKGSTHAVITIKKNDSSESLRRKIIATYLSGYSVIEIKTKGVKIQSKHFQVIRDLVRSSFIGTEIVESSSGAITLQVLTKLSQLSFDIALNRMYINASNMHKESIEALKACDKTYGEEVVKMDDEVDRFSLYLMRNLSLALQNGQVLHDSGINEPEDCLGYRTVVRCVERIADHAALIAKKIKYLEKSIETRVLKEIEKLSHDSLSVFEDSIASLSKHDYPLAEKVTSSVATIVEREKKLMDSLKETQSNTTIIKLILEDIRRTAEYSSDIAEVAMDENVQSVILEK